MSDSVKVPEWKARRWQSLKNFLARPEVHKATMQFQEDFGFPEYSILTVGKVMEKFGLPYECQAAYLFLITEPDATDEQLLHFIQSPIKWVSHAHGVVGPSDDPSGEYARTVSIVPDELTPEFNNVSLQIAPSTTHKELRAFLNRYYTHQIKPLAKYPMRVIEERQPPEFSKVGGRVTKREQLNKIEHDILLLGEANQPAKEIQAYIQDNYHKLMELSDIRSRLKHLRQKR